MKNKKEFIAIVQMDDHTIEELTYGLCQSILSSTVQQKRELLTALYSKGLISKKETYYDVDIR